MTVLRKSKGLILRYEVIKWFDLRSTIVGTDECDGDFVFLERNVTFYLK